MGMTLSAAQIREAETYARGFADGRAVGLRAAARMRAPARRDAAHEAALAAGHALVADLIAEVAARYGVTPAELTGRAQPGALRRARFTACWLAFRLSGLAASAIGGAMGGRDHTTVLHAVKRFGAFAAENRDWMIEARDVAATLGQRLPDEARR